MQGARDISADEDIFLFEERRNARSAFKINASWVGLRDHQINIKALLAIVEPYLFFTIIQKDSKKRDFSPTSTI